MLVRVFKNLNLSKGNVVVWSVQTKVGKAWRTVAHTESAVVLDGTFYFSEASRVRCAAKGQREVHAWVQGTLAGISSYRMVAKWYDETIAAEFRDVESVAPISDLPRSVTYNPFVAPEFRFRDSGDIVKTAARVHFTRHCTI